MSATARLRADVLDAPVEIIDLLPAFEGHPDPLSLFPFRAAGHYNARGYAHAARTIRDSLESLEIPLP
jgi:hypothetical protein